MGCIFNAPADAELSTSISKNNDSDDSYIKNKYTFGRILGKGGSCRVIMVTEKTSKSQFALKIMSVQSKVNRELYHKEQKILMLLDHPNIIKFVECHEGSKSFYIVTELLEGGELFDRIVDTNYTITEKTASQYVKTMLLAIKHCHDKSIVHRDIKPENFVFKSKDPDSEMVLIDFGCAKVVEKKREYKDLLGTPYYLAPESAAGNRYVRTGEILMSSDLWAIGVITYVLMTGRPPFNGNSNSAIFKNIIRKPLRFPEKVALSKPFKKFCTAILKKSPKHRMKLEDALANPWVKGEKSSNQKISKDVLRVLRQFNRQSKFKKAICKVLATHMGEEPRKKIKEHFNSLDKDNNSKLDAEELSHLLMEMGYTEIKAKEEAKVIIKSTDEDKSGFIEFHEFATVWQRKLLSTNEAYIHSVFSVFDTDGNGLIDATELGQVLNLTKEGDDVKIAEIIKEVDIDNDGKINFEEFRAAMVEMDDFGGSGAEVGFKLKEDEVHQTEKDYVDIDEADM